MESASSAILDTLYSLIFAEDEIIDGNARIEVKDAKVTTSPSIDSAEEMLGNPVEKGASHLFHESTFTMPTFCNYCKEYIWGFTTQGHTCSVCGYNTHAKCTQRAPHTCRPKLSAMLQQNLRTLERELVESSPKPIPASVDSGRHIVFRHHLVEGDLPLGVECDVCADAFEIFGSHGWRCSRCEKMVHDECKGAIEKQGCKSRHQRLFYIHPNIQSQVSKEGQEQTPLIVFVNGRSGGQYGSALIHEFARLLDRSQVFDLNMDKGAERGLRKFLGTPNLRILVSGGDGTVGWVLSTLDKLELDNYPPIGIVPLGTGNDLARTLGWGAGYSGEEVSPILDAVEAAKIVKLDRWKVVVDGENSEKKGILNNYMSVGVDAEVALEFHNLRNNQPELFTSTFVNKFWYANYGIKSMFSEIEELGAFCSLYVDGQPISLPSGVGGIMILNLPSYAGGSNLWGENTDKNGSYQPQAIDDKTLEIVAITGSFHMGTIHVNLSQAIRIGQGSHVKIELSQKIPIQVDGEPWLQEPCAIDITFFNQARMLYSSTESRIFRGTTEGDEALLHENKLLRAEVAQVKAENEELRKKVEQLQTQLSRESLLVDVIISDIFDDTLTRTIKCTITSILALASPDQTLRIDRCLLEEHDAVLFKILSWPLRKDDTQRITIFLQFPTLQSVDQGEGSESHLNRSPYLNRCSSAIINQ
ncbi:diacylglycerol kinase epsilon-like [Planoprotostelium fungivorum]|uniref:Diacylglycerol kinase n=1 Tax=Planoprotostelium fungivorum TaxID=1890364 RepID=A0A2P6NL33_9EUKA|nr:diacylglycerol kinase epsilon-like [Planoprotostelium fungivorum]